MKILCFCLGYELDGNSEIRKRSTNPIYVPPLAQQGCRVAAFLPCGAFLLYVFIAISKFLDQQSGRHPGELRTVSTAGCICRYF